MSLVDPSGKPLKSHARPPKPKPIDVPMVGDKFGQWAGRDTVALTLPGGGVMQFDLSRLTLADFRAMRQNYQLGASLSVLTFIMHQIDWHIECESQSNADFLTEDLMENWTPLIRGMSQAFWAGFSPHAINYKNTTEGRFRIDRIKDLVPEECRVRWKHTEGWAESGKAKPRIYHYDGLYHNNSWILPENTLWYPLLMENGDHYGRKLLAAAFPSWFFSQLIHLFANRYFERFGEPLPIARAPFGEDLDVGDNTMMSSQDVMKNIVMGVRSRAAAVLPSDRDPTTKEFDYTLEYLESQMRGADFERYLSRLDEEMSLAVFTPILLFRTADVGSYNLGVAHLRIFQQMLNAVSGDMQYYFQNYLVDRMNVLNFGQNAPRARWIYRKQGMADLDQFKEVMSALIQQEAATPNLEELAAITGVSWDKVEKLVEEPAPPTVDENGDPIPLSLAAAKTVLSEAAVRAVSEYANGSTAINLGYRNRLRNTITKNGGGDRSDDIIETFYEKANRKLALAVRTSEDADHFKAYLDQMLLQELDLAVNS